MRGINMSVIKVPTYYNVENFEIVDERTFHFYNDEETPFVAVQIIIGKNSAYNVRGTGVDIIETPIIRWISKNEYNRLLEGSGTIIF